MVKGICLAAACALALTNPARAQFAAAPGGPFPAGGGPSAIAVGDFNGDSLPDVAIANTAANTVTVLLGTLTGALVPLSPTSAAPTVNAPTSIVAADFNSDGKLDLAVASASGGTVTIFLGKGDGTFQTGVPLAPVSSGPAALAIGDFNLDQCPDLAVAYKTTTGNNVAVFLNAAVQPAPPGAVTCTGSFKSNPSSPVMTAAGKAPSSIAVGNFGGFPGLAVANELDGSVSVLMGSGPIFASNNGLPTVSFTAVQPAVNVLTTNPTSAFPISVAVVDVNGDGLPDLVTANLGTNNVSVLLANPISGFTPAPGSPLSLPSGAQPVAVAAADFNRDGNQDLAVLNNATGNLSVLLGTGSGTFQAAVNLALAGAPSPVGLAVGDFNNDGNPDVAITDAALNEAVVLLNGYCCAVTMVSSASGAHLAAPGALVSLYGSSLAAGPVTASTPQLPVSLGGASIVITYSNGAQDALPLYYASPIQINALIPLGATPGPASYTVIGPTGRQSGTILIDALAPALFAANLNGIGAAWAQFLATPSFVFSNAFQCPSGQAGSCVPLPWNAELTGSYLILYGTGLHNATTQEVTVMVGGTPIVPSYVGPSSSQGEDQVNVPLPTYTTGPGLVSVTLVVTLPNASTVLHSNSVTVYLR